MFSDYQLRSDYDNAKKEFQTITNLINSSSQTNIKQSFNFLTKIDKQKRTRVWTEVREQKQFK